jgi:hypothetical protein
VGVGNFSLHQHIQNGNGAQPASYPMGIGDSFPGVKWPGHEIDHSPPSTADAKNAQTILPLPQYIFIVQCFVKHMDNFTFYCNLSLCTSSSWKKDTVKCLQIPGNLELILFFILFHDGFHLL